MENNDLVVWIYLRESGKSFWKDEIMKVAGKIGEICIGERKLLGKSNTRHDSICVKNVSRYSRGVL